MSQDPSTGTEAPRLAPGVPDDYYDRIRAAEDQHWWYLGMRRIGEALLDERPAGRLLDAGCGTGGYLEWALSRWPLDSVAGIDISSAAIAFARKRLPEADLRTGKLESLPWPDGSFDVVVSHDVLQHVHEEELRQSVEELRRVLVPDGLLLLRTNASRRLRRERDDWRAFDAASLRELLEASGFHVERLTHASLPLSLWGNLTGKAPHAPTTERAGVPTVAQRRSGDGLRKGLLNLEARFLARRGRAVPYGHNLFALATRA